MLKQTALEQETTVQGQAPDPVVVEDREDQVTLLLQGLTCAACVLKVEKALKKQAGVRSVQVNLAESIALIQGNADPKTLLQSVIDAGYGAEIVEDERTRREKYEVQIQREIRQRKQQGITALFWGLLLMLWGLFGGSMMVTAENRSYWAIVGALTLAIMLFSGGHFFQRAVLNLRRKTATMDTLVALGTGTAWLFSMSIVLIPSFFPENSRHLYFEASAMIIGLVNLGKMLEVKAKQRSSRALESLVDLSPKTARIVTEQGEQEILLEQVQHGMILRLKTGDKVGVDGTVIEGQAWVDESMLTGEPLPVEKTVGEKVSAGTLVADGTLLFRAEQVGQQTMLAHIIRTVRQAQSSKPQIAQLADKISAIFVPVVIAIALFASAIWYVYGPQPNLSYALVIFTTILIISCPCALGLAIPMSIIAGIGRAAELGILVRDADALQKAARADTLVFDKTGTLTQGLPKVTALYCFNDYQQTEVIQFAATLEQGASHPLAKAILDFAATHKVDLTSIAHFQTLQGLGVQGVGVQGKIAKKQILLGNKTLMLQQDIDCHLAEDIFQQKSAVGSTVVFLAVEKQLAGVFVLQDPLREDSAQALQRLAKQGYQLIMLTGDQEKTAQSIAQGLPIKRIIAGVLPSEKAQVIVELQQQGHKVVMVGDGINDAPALAQADVSIAMGTGSDIAIETSELTLMRHSISAVADGIVLSKGILSNMKQNLLGAFVYNVLGIPIAAGVLYPFWQFLLNPMIAGVAMALSSITVATNANRLQKFKVKED
ncbi:copper-transporting P-type ATPase [Canicola haemoglobinophilus]|uniref:Copper-exporting P-type ATPase n=1 Tax=Canicola haemoglobinophilus TaxID=733 RepID=A0A377HVR7_9PAST|nr:copper-transporting P-type ATPase [Canicola haemoglobinophilus]